MRLLALLFLLLAFAAVSFADVPQLINYQGKLADESSTPLDTTVSVTFQLYGLPNGGAAFWTETHPAVGVVNGIFDVKLGSISPLSDLLFSSGDRWLGITVGNNAEMMPRQQFVSVATALRVATIDAATGGYISGDVNFYGKVNVGHNNTNEGNHAFVNGQFNHARGDFSVIAGGGNSDPVDSNSVSGPWGTISGGRHNTVIGLQGTIAGGNTNAVSGTDATISGGSFNVASAYGTAVSGGLDNAASQSYATISGGISNRASGSFATVSGGSENIVSNEYAAVGGGQSNIASGMAANVGGGSRNRARGDYSVIAGGGGPDAADSNLALGSSSSISGGFRNIVSGNSSTIGGGAANLASGGNSTIAGGASNVASQTYSTVGGGLYNIASDYNTTVGGGGGNTASQEYATVGGGAGNVASGLYSTVGGGLFNRARGEYSVVAGGGAWLQADSNSAIGDYSAIGGGRSNESNAYYGTVAGGTDNRAGDAVFDTAAFVGGGALNLAANRYATIGGGYSNAATSSYTTVGGGYSNSAGGVLSTISGGSQNTTYGDWAVVGGGFHNVANSWSVVSGGDSNQAIGGYACVPGGFHNFATGGGAFAAGMHAHAGHDGSFVWGNSFTGDTTGSFNPYTVTFRCENGARFYTAASGTATGVGLPAGGGAWANLCDANQKRLHGEVNTSDVLQKVSSLPLHRWSYKSQAKNVQHIGPTAQDFHAAFGLGDNNTTISTLDPDGVLFAAVQELAKRNEEQAAEIAELKQLVRQMIEVGNRLE